MTTERERTEAEKIERVLKFILIVLLGGFLIYNILRAAQREAWDEATYRLLGLWFTCWLYEKIRGSKA